MQYIIRHEPEFTYGKNGRTLIRSRKQVLMDLNRGDTWRWMSAHIFPQLRSSASVMFYLRNLQDKPVEEPVEMPAEEECSLPDEVIEEIIAEEWTEPATVPAVADYIFNRYPIMALRSNLLLPLLNVGVEVPVAEHWSVGADYYYPWIWPAKSNKNCFELLFVSAEARYWFNPNKGQYFQNRNYMIGHSVGLYGAWGYYDFEHNWEGHQGDFWSVGVDYLYALPIAKGRLRLEFEFALGFIMSHNAKPYKVYESGGHLIKDFWTKNYSYFGPTKIGVSLVLPINRKVKQSAPVMP